MKLTSSAFAEGQPIPRRHSCEGEDLSPPLSWTDLPDGTSALALIVDDPDAPGGTFTHWLAWAPVEGPNDFGQTGYRGPCPPPGHGPHRYFFRLHVLTEELELQPAATRDEVESALSARSQAVAELMGTYER
jgi:phosphatidylethanolamine-binding protein (PEBP) family uncharacterized protein